MEVNNAGRLRFSLLSPEAKAEVAYKTFNKLHICLFYIHRVELNAAWRDSFYLCKFIDFCYRKAKMHDFRQMKC